MNALTRYNSLTTKRTSLSGFDAVDFLKRSNRKKNQDSVPPLYQRHLKSFRVDMSRKENKRIDSIVK